MKIATNVKLGHKSCFNTLGVRLPRDHLREEHKEGTKGMFDTRSRITQRSLWGLYTPSENILLSF